MNVRAQLVMVFNLDKCIGCHACSISCKNIWTDRKSCRAWCVVDKAAGLSVGRDLSSKNQFRGNFNVGIVQRLEHKNSDTPRDRFKSAGCGLAR